MAHTLTTENLSAKLIKVEMALIRHILPKLSQIGSNPMAINERCSSKPLSNKINRICNKNCHKKLLSMCYHGSQEIPKEKEKERKESTFKDKGNPTYAGFRSKWKTRSFHRKSLNSRKNHTQWGNQSSLFLTKSWIKKLFQYQQREIFVSIVINFYERFRYFKSINIWLRIRSI